MKKFEISTYWV